MVLPAVLLGSVIGYFWQSRDIPTTVTANVTTDRAGFPSSEVTELSDIPGAPTAAGLRSISNLPRELNDYVMLPDEQFGWTVTACEERSLLGRPLGKVHTLQVRSQQWQGVVWQHEVLVYIPVEVQPGRTWLLWIDGDPPPRSKADTLGLLIAAQIRAPFVMLFGVPNQPLLDGQREDALIAETLARYLQTQNSSWPLLFPMVKSVLRTMDALQAYARQQLNCQLERFVLAGASKRGWTAWLTAATGDLRVQAIAPVVFDTLNLPAQMEQQVRAFGTFSEMIRDYRERGLLPIPDTPAARRLWAMIDPWTYCSRLQLPKLIINGTNDPYWPVDALNLYWDGLPGAKWLLYVPNAGHYICERRPDGREESLPRRAIATLTSFASAQIHQRPLPRLDWQWQPVGDGHYRLIGRSDPAPRTARLFVATTDSRDFRRAWWQEQAVPLSSDLIQVTIPPQSKAFTAAFVEVEFEADGHNYTLSSPIRVWKSSAH